MLRLAFDFIITWRETRTRPNAYLNHLFLENFAVRHAVSYGESGRELNLVAAEDKTEYEKDKLL